MSADLSQRNWFRSTPSVLDGLGERDDDPGQLVADGPQDGVDAVPPVAITNSVIKQSTDDDQTTIAK